MLNLILSDPEMALVITGKNKRRRGLEPGPRVRTAETPTPTAGTTEPMRRPGLLGRLRDVVADE